MNCTTTGADGPKVQQPNSTLLPDILRAIPDPVVVANAAGQILLVNEAVEKTFGYQPKRLIGEKVEILIPQHLRRRHRAHRGAYLSNPTFRPMGESMEMTGLRADGTEFPVAISLGFTEWEGRKVSIATVLDLTKRKEQADQSKTEFIAMVSHELRTPLTAIRGSLTLVTSGAAGPLPDRATALLKTAAASCERLTRLVNDILDLEKTESGRMEFDWQPINVAAIVEQQIEANRAFAEEYGVHLRLERPAQQAMVRADADRLSQVVTNLLSNATKFSPRGAEVTVKVETVDDTVCISVRDRGPGIPEAFKARIFEKFAQSKTGTGGHRSGTGLGLTIVRQIVTRLGGEVGFEDAPGGGTTFFVKLPRLTTEAAKTPAETQKQLLSCGDLQQSNKVA